MKTALIALVLALFASILSPASAAGLKLGTFELTGYNSHKMEKPSYHGYVIIKKTGETYALTWKIGRQQTQRGVALLTDGVLSVSYLDNSGRDAGVVSYRVLSAGSLDGLWCPLGSKGCGREVLVWKSVDEASINGADEGALP